jgi:myo-inositol 2-dehydrogenase/D-chiro-inositol 1-dehydrogenase
MTAARIRFGLLSFAHPHAQAWATAAARSDDAELIGIWDDDPARGQAMAAAHGTTFFADLDALLARCDAVGITAETTQHPALVERAAAAKVDVLCEKPAAVDIAAFERIEAAVRRSGIFYAQSFPKRLDPASLELRRLVSDGRLGRVGLIRLRHGHGHGLDPAFRGTWFADPARSGGGALLDEGVHALDFVAWLLGRPAWIRAALSNGQLQLAVEDTAIVILGYRDGRLAEISTSWVFVAADNSIEIHGDGGSAVLGGVDLASRDLVSSGHLRVCTEQPEADRRRAWEVIDVCPAFQDNAFHELAVRRFVADLRLNRAPEIGLADARQSLELVDAAYEAARTGRTVML